MRSYSFDISKSSEGEGYTVDNYKTLNKASRNDHLPRKVSLFSAEL